MDVRSGLCWRCNGKLHNQFVKCSSCSIAEYCSNRCKETDIFRHGSVECPTWSKIQRCNGCGEVKEIKKCSGCYSTCYCSVECQRRDFPKHHPECQQWRTRTLQVANMISKVKETMADYPFYFSNSMAKDFLNLICNELSSHSSSRYVADINVLFTACGDLRHVMQTIKSLPTEFSAGLRFVLNDIDPFVMARNVLIMFMAVTLPPKNASSISSIWLSTQLTTGDFKLLQDTLSILTKLDGASLKGMTSGVIEVNEESFGDMCYIWTRWSQLECLIGKKDCINLHDDRKSLFEADRGSAEGMRSYLMRVPKKYVPSITKWFEDGVIVPAASQNKKLIYYNPTFTGRVWPLTNPFNKTELNTRKFQYCVRPDCIPFQMWDSLEMSLLASSHSVTELCHAFTKECVIQTMRIVKDNHLHVEIWTKDFLDLLSFMPKGQSFDRIVTSNLVDYYGICKVINTLEPLLSKENLHATLLTETINWTYKVYESAYPSMFPEINKLLECAENDTNLSKTNLMFQGSALSREYYNNMPHFACYIRGQKLVDCIHKISQIKLPKISDISFGGLYLRNIFKGQNQVVPFNNRTNVRPLNMLSGTARTLEWYRKPQSECQQT